MSNNLGLDQVAENQAAKEVTINTATGQLDAALTEALALDYTPNVDITLTTTQFQRNIRFRANNLTSGKQLILPAVKKLAMFNNSPANSGVLTVAQGATTIALAPGDTVFLYCSGTALSMVSMYNSSSIKPYDVATYCNGKPDNSEMLLRFSYVRAVTLPAGLAGSRVTAAVAATATTNFVVAKNGTPFATLRFAAAGTVASVVGMASDMAFAVNDQLSIQAPSVADATLADIAFTFAGVQ